MHNEHSIFRQDQDPADEHEAIVNEVLSSTPDRCIKCPVMCSISTELYAAKLRANTLGKIANDMVGGEIGQMLDDLAHAASGDDDDLALEFQTTSRQSVAKEQDRVDADIDDISSTMRNMSAECSSPLIMRASKGDATYLVSVCTSPEAYTLMGEHTPTHVSRTPSEDL